MVVYQDTGHTPQGINDGPPSPNPPNQTGDGVCAAYGVGGEDAHPRRSSFRHGSLRWGVVGGDDADARQNHRCRPRSAGHGLLAPHEADASASHPPGIPCAAVYRSRIRTPCHRYVQHPIIKFNRYGPCDAYRSKFDS